MPPNSKNPLPITQNQILALLPRNELDRLWPSLASVKLAQGDILGEAGVPLTHAFFPDAGIISIVSSMENGASIEVGVVGNEGMAGLAEVLGSEAIPYRHVVQAAGRGWRVSAAALRRELERDGALRRLLNRYQAALLTQAMQGMACNGLHSLEQRCCRWLLTTQDRLGSRELDITHDFLAQMLGVRRASVTEVLRPLQSDGLILAKRGKVTILDSKRLAAASCECYELIRCEYQRLLGDGGKKQMRVPD